MPNQTDPNQVADTTNVPPVSVPNTDLPPLPDFMNVPTSPTPSEPLTPPTDDSSGSAAPSDLPPVMSAPKKKFGGGKIIATILGQELSLPSNSSFSIKKLPLAPPAKLKQIQLLEI
jgi:hypothetical protein